MKNTSLLVVFMLVILHCTYTAGKKFKIRLGVGEPDDSEDYRNFEDEWFEQQLDHFDPTVSATWYQRFFTNAKYFNTTDAPVFLMIEGEGRASPRWLEKGSWMVPAKKHGALLFQLEHRYYGASHPTEDTSTDNLKYLSSQQALADVAYFIAAMNKKYHLTKKNKWIAFGGSYAGNLAAWVRVEYPHLVHAAVSSSAPLLAKVDFKDYFKVVAASLASNNKHCVKYVKAANHKLEKLLHSRKGRRQIKKLFRLCSPIKPKKKEDVASLFENLADNFAVIVQYNNDNRNSSTNNTTITTLCDIMTNKTIGDPVKRYAAVNTLLNPYKNSSDCLSYKYDNLIEFYRETNWTSNAVNSSYRQWQYQTCTEYGYYQTSSRKNSVFSSKFPISYFEKTCKDVFGAKFNKTLLEHDVYRTNVIYGERNIRAERIVHVHGSIDPWHALGITHSTSEEQPAIFIKGTSHCANMYTPNENDPPELKAAREKIDKLIDKWLEE